MYCLSLFFLHLSHCHCYPIDSLTYSEPNEAAVKTLHLLKLRARLCEPRDRGKSDLVEDMEVMMLVFVFVVVYHVTIQSKRECGIEESMTCNNTLRPTHPCEFVIDTI